MTRSDSDASFDLVVLAHRLPGDGQGSPGWRDGPASTTDALRAVVAARGAAWIGCLGSAGQQGGTPGDALCLRPVPLTPRENHAYFRGHCTSSLAPLYFDYPQPQYRSAWQDAYRQVNQRFAEAAARIAAPAATIWVHDYHLQLVPGYLRRIRPDLNIGFFLHSPFPPPERFLQQPLRTQILASLRQADLIGFQQARSARNFLDVCADLPDQQGGAGTTRVEVCPASVDVTRIAKLAGAPGIRARADAIRTQLGSPRVVLLSVGALDRAECVEGRLDAYAQLLTDNRLDPHDTVLVHVAPSGDDTPGHQHHRDHIDRQVARINGVFSRLGRPVVHYLRRGLDVPELVALYIAADVLLATPIHHGAAPPAIEFVAARTADTGRLVLSEFTATATDLPEADLVNPYDSDAVADAIAAATANCHTASGAMRRMRLRLDDRDAHAWASNFLAALEATPVGHGTALH